MFDKILDSLKTNAGLSPGLVVAIVGLIIFWFLPEALLEPTKRILLEYLSLWLTIIFLLLFKEIWMKYVQTKAEFENEYTLLEIRLPEEVTQSPLAMETALNAFFHTGTPQHIYEKYLEGKLREQSSLEIVSFEGDVRFFVRVRAKIRPVVESQLYSQYPTIEIEAVPDYMSRIPYNPKVHDLFGVYQTLEKPDPYPIKTYVDFGLDKETKEEFKIDPLSAVIEFLGSMGKGEYGMYQIIIRSHQAEKRKPGTWFGTEDWQKEAERETNKILENIKVKNGESTSVRQLTEGEKDTIAALDRNVGKKPFDTGIRVIYLANRDNFDGNKRNGLPTIMRSFQSHSLNNFKPKFPTMVTYKFQDPLGTRVQAAKWELYNAYRWRSYISPPYKSKYGYFVLSSEELATVYHFPGRVTQTPTLGRITSRREEAPPNIPR